MRRNAKIAAYMAKDSDPDEEPRRVLLVAIGILFLIFFYSTLRIGSRMPRAPSSRSGALVFAAGLLSITFTFVAISLFVSTLLVASDADKFPLDPGIYRIAQDLGYPLCMARTMVRSLVAWGRAASGQSPGRSR